MTSELGYSAMNSARSALSALLKPTDGVSFGKHPMISRLLKGMFRQRPALPKYTVTYDASEVISFMASDAISSSETLEMLSYKLATIMALLSGSKVSKSWKTLP